MRDVDNLSPVVEMILEPSAAGPRGAGRAALFVVTVVDDGIAGVGLGICHATEVFVTTKYLVH